MVVGDQEVVKCNEIVNARLDNWWCRACWAGALEPYLFIIAVVWVFPGFMNSYEQLFPAGSIGADTFFFILPNLLITMSTSFSAGPGFDLYILRPFKKNLFYFFFCWIFRPLFWDLWTLFWHFVLFHSVLEGGQNHRSNVCHDPKTRFNWSIWPLTLQHIQGQSNPIQLVRKSKASAAAAAAAAAFQRPASDASLPRYNSDWWWVAAIISVSLPNRIRDMIDTEYDDNDVDIIRFRLDEATE